MENRNRFWFITIVVALVIVLGVFVPYNSLVEMRNEVRAQQAQIENVLQARLEKIPNLVLSVKEYVRHEEAVFTVVAEAYDGLQNAINSGDMEQMADANEQLSVALKHLNLFVEAYPELKASYLFSGLNDEIAGAINRITQERRKYNQMVKDYNNKLETIPTVMYASMFGFHTEQFFEASAEAHETNVVDFGD